jgi:hypothetical protein
MVRLPDSHSLEQLGCNHVLQVFACGEIRDAVTGCVTGHSGVRDVLTDELGEHGSLTMIQRVGRRECIGHREQSLGTLAQVFDQFRRCSAEYLELVQQKIRQVALSVSVYTNER